MAITKEEMAEMLSDQQKGFEAAREEVRKQHGELDGRLKTIDTQLEKAGKENSEAKDAFAKQVETVERVEKDLTDMSKKLQALQGAGGAANDAKSLGERLTDQKGAIESYKGGAMTLLEHDGPLESKAVTSDPTASVGLLIEPLRRPGYLDHPEEPLWIRDLIPTLSISTNAVEWFQEVDGSFTNNAAIQAAEGDTKAESDGPRFELKTESVKTIAHWIRMSRQVLQDLALLRSMIEMKMVRGLKEVEQQQILFGSGTGANLNGLVPQATAYDATANVAGDTKVDQVRRAALQSDLALYPTDTIVVNPTEWAEIELMKTDDKAYLFSNPTSGAEKRLWGKTIIEAHGQTQGDFLAGGLRTGATLWDREQVTVRVAEQHENFFVQNMVALLVEERVMLTVERPQAFVKGTFV